MRRGLAAFLVGLAVVSAGCEKPACLGCGRGIGVPVLFAVDGGALAITKADQCTVTVDFGDGGGGAEVLLRVEDYGSGTLDLMQPDGSGLGLAYTLRLPTLAPVPPGGFDEFAIEFEPPDAGSFKGTLTIETDGDNTTCRNPSQLTVSLSGSTQ